MMGGKINYQPFSTESAEIGAQGEIQQHLTTIELGFTPFIPLSQQFITAITQGADGSAVYGSFQGQVPTNTIRTMEQESWSLLPHDLEDVDPGKSTKWLDTLRAWEQLNGLDTLEDAVNEAPTANLAAARLGRSLADVISGKVIKTVGEGPHRGELIEQATVQAMLETIGQNPNQWSGGAIGNILPPGRVIPKATGKGPGEVFALSSETVDLSAENEAKARILEYQLNRMGDWFGAEFVQNSLGIETTEMKSEKYFQHTLQTSFSSEQEILDNFQESATTDVDHLIGMIRRSGRTLDSAHQQLDRDYATIVAANGGQRPSGADTPEYAARQLADRFRRIQREGWFEAFHFEMPLTSRHVGYMRIQPAFDSRGLPLPTAQGTDVDARAYDVSGLLDVLATGGDFLGSIISTTKRKGDTHRQVGATQWVGLHVNALLHDFFVNFSQDRAAVLAIASIADQQTVNDLALRGNRGEMIGTMLSTEVNMMPIEALGAAPTVSAMEILSDKETARSLQEQVLTYFSQASVQSYMGKLLKAAEGQSQLVTDQWKIAAEIASVRKQPRVFGDPLYTGLHGQGQTLQRMGMPFWMTMGRDSQAYKIFREKHWTGQAYSRFAQGTTASGGMPMYDPEARIVPTFASTQGFAVGGKYAKTAFIAAKARKRGLTRGYNEAFAPHAQGL